MNPIFFIYLPTFLYIFFWGCGSGAVRGIDITERTKRCYLKDGNRGFLGELFFLFLNGLLYCEVIGPQGIVRKAEK